MATSKSLAATSSATEADAAVQSALRTLDAEGSGITALTAIYYTFRDKGPPSTGLIEVNALGFSPTVGPDFAGVAMGGHFK